MDALREVARLQELVAVEDQLLSSKEAQLAMKDELLAAKDQLLASKGGLTVRIAEEPCQYKSSDHYLDDNVKRQRLHYSSSFDSASPFDRDEVLDHLFSYVGGGDHLYAAGVSRRWRGRYLQYCAQTTTCAQDKKLATRNRSVIMSKSRLLHAKANGFSIASLDMTQDKHAELLCKHSLEPERVLTVLHLHGVPWDVMMCRNAAFLNKLGLLQWLHSNDCEWEEGSVLCNASRGGSVPMLLWLVTVTQPWSEAILGEMLTAAASCDRLAAAQWLGARGAQWPLAFASEYIDINNVATKQCWSVSTVQWAVAAGSG
jgi:hypothetical protein